MLYGIHSIPEDSAKIFTEIGVASFVYQADNDNAGEIGASNLRTLLRGQEWKGEGEYRKVAGAGILEMGDAELTGTFELWLKAGEITQAIDEGQLTWPLA